MGIKTGKLEGTKTGFMGEARRIEKRGKIKENKVKENKRGKKMDNNQIMIETLEKENLLLKENIFFQLS